MTYTQLHTALLALSASVSRSVPTMDQRLLTLVLDELNHAGVYYGLHDHFQLKKFTDKSHSSHQTQGQVTVLVSGLL